jgi:hypothetical protein
LSSFFPQFRCVIVNADNHSADGTRETFLSTETRACKEYVSTPDGTKGKGENLLRFFALAADCGVRAAATVDADLESIAPDWMRRIFVPLLEGHDFVFPVYSRFRYDGAITSQLCYPVLTGVYGCAIRQPIGGEFGFSRRFLDHLAQADVPAAARGFGIDIHLTTQAVEHRFRSCGVVLGRKIHRKRDRATLGPMLAEVTASLFANIRQAQTYRRNVATISSPALFGEEAFHACPPVSVSLSSLADLYFAGVLDFGTVYELAFDRRTRQAITEMAERRGPLQIDKEMWCDLVYGLLAAHLSDPQESKLSAAIVPLFFARMFSFVTETQHLSDAEVEADVRALAELFFAQRHKLSAARLTVLPSEETDGFDNL